MPKKRLPNIERAPGEEIDPLEHQGLVWSIAHAYARNGHDAEDLAGYGQFGLRRACELWDPSRGAEFSTYATLWIKQAIQEAITQREPLIRIPRHLQIKIASGIRPDSPGLKPKQRACIAAAIHVLEHRGEFRGDDETGALEDVLVDHRTGPDPDRGMLLDLLKSLPHRDRMVILLRFGFDGPALTLNAIGNRLGLTRERIRQIEARALAALRSRLVGADPSPVLHQSPTHRGTAHAQRQRRARRGDPQPGGDRPGREGESRTPRRR